MPLSERELIIAHWFMATESMVVASITMGIDPAMFRKSILDDMEEFRKTNAPSISREEMLEIRDELTDYHKKVKDILKYSTEDKDDKFGV